MAVKAGVIVAWPSGAPIPAGWTRAIALDALYPRGADVGHDAGATGGTVSHTHTSAAHGHGVTLAHTHGAGAPGGDTPPSEAGIGKFGSPFDAVAYYLHQHAAAAPTSATDTTQTSAAGWTTILNDPVYRTTVWIASDGTPVGVPIGALVYTTAATPPATAPAGFVADADAATRYLKGADTTAGGGTNGGAGTHTHLGAAHTHVTDGHTHGSATSSPPTGPGSIANSTPAVTTGTYQADPGHEHPLTFNPGVYESASAASGATGVVASDPPFHTLLACRATTVASPLGIIALWNDTAASIPAGWSLCDGTGGTPDLRGVFIKSCLVDGSDVGVTGGAAGHTHTAGAGHAHDDPGHFHGVLVASEPRSAHFDADESGRSFIPSPHTHPLIFTAPNNQVAALPSATQTVGTTADTRPQFADVLFIQQTTILTVAISSPASGAALDEAAIPISWTLTAGRTQQDYRITVLDATGVAIYDSGIVVSAIQAATVPAGHTRNGQAYTLVVTATDTGAVSGSAAEPVTIAYSTPPAVAGLSATPAPDQSIPAIVLAWTPPTIRTDGAFGVYTFKRRPHGTTVWTVLGTDGTLAHDSFSDFTCARDTLYDYSVVYTEVVGLDTLTAPDPSPLATATLTFAPPTTVAALTAVGEPGGIPPDVLLTWAAPTLTAWDTFVRYVIERREPGAPVWDRIAAITTRLVTSYHDLTAAPGVLYEYAVIYDVTRDRFTLTSSEQDPAPQADVAFVGVWIHVVQDPTVAFLYSANTGGIKGVQDQLIVPVRGRHEPTVHIGEQRYEVYTFQGIEALYPVDGWKQLADLADRARDAQILCVRFGNAEEKLFGLVDWNQTTRQDAEFSYNPTLYVTRCYFDEANQVP